MKRKELQPMESPAQSPPKSPAPPRPRPRPRPQHRTSSPPPQQPPGKQDNGEEDEDESFEPAPTWRRRRSVTFSSPARKSASPTRSPASPEDDSMAPWDNHFHMYDDEFARAQSPYRPTQMEDGDDAMPGESSQVPNPPSTPPPSTPSEPNEIIDITSDSDGDAGGDGTSRSRPSSRSGSASGSNSMDETDRKKMYALKRMMPKVMWKQLDKRVEAKKRAAAARASASVERDGDEESGDGGDRPLRPGESRKVIRRTLSSRSIEIRGDSESSDMDIPPSPVMDADNAPILDLTAQESSDETGLSSSEESVIEPIRHQPRPKYRPYQTGGAPSEGDPPSSEESDHDDAGRGLSPARAPRMRRVMRDGEAEVDNSVDRMLARTVYDKPRVKRRRRRNGVRRVGGGGHGTGGGHRHAENGASGGHRSGGHGGGSNGVRSAGLRFTTSGAKRYGAGRQTLLPFQPLPTPDAGDGDIELIDPPPVAPHNEVHFAGDEAAKAKQKAAKAKTKQAGVYIFNTGNTHLLGGRANAEHVNVEQEVAVSRGPAVRDHRPSNSTSKSKSKSKFQGKDSKRLQTSTLTQLWGTDEQYEDDGFVIPDAPLPARGPESLSQPEREVHLLRHVTVDLDVHPLPAGLAFPNATYLGHGWLHELVNLLPGTHDAPSPPSCSMFDCYLHSDMSVSDLSGCLDGISDRLRNLILGGAGPADYESCHQWQTFLHALSQHISWLLARVQEGEHTALVTDVESFARRLASLLEEPIEILPDDETPNPLVLQALWFLLEVSARLALDQKRRMEVPDTLAVAASLKALIAKLWDFTFGTAAIPLDLTRDGLAQPSIAQQIAELWVCVLNLANDGTFRTAFFPQGSSFWTTYLQVLQAHGLHLPHTELKVREVMWKSIFTLCALSQFSIHGNSSMTPRIPPSWATIVSVLERAPLSKDEKVDEKLSRRVIHKRDEYVRVLVCRCLWLNLKWHWRLDVDDASLVFNRLNDIFKSRRFASLADEQSDFPAFLRHYNLALLKAKNRSDTAFTLFLKLVVRAADDVRKYSPQFAELKMIPPSLKKVLSLAVPVGSVPFTKTKPPTNHELSMLYNRFSAIAVAIYLEPTEANSKYRLSTARRYVNFRDADDETRRACIRGSMHLAILLRHLDLPLTDTLAWLEDMTNVLIDEYQASDASKGTPGEPRLKSGTVLSIQLLLGSIRRILETSSMDSEQKKPKYPDPALLQGAWVHRVFSMTNNLSTITSTGEEIRRLVQAFLDARGRVIPKRRRPRPRGVLEDSQESQDYGFEQLDFDDPELLLALGEEVVTPEQREQDKIVADFIFNKISPAMYRLVCKHFNDPAYQQAGELSFRKADDWVDCWVGCCNVVVQNNDKDWEFFLDYYGPQSWERIIEPCWRRRVGLRFMYMLLQLDPPAYLRLTDRFVDVLFASIATPNVTIEHEYASLLLSIDRLQHPLFAELPIGAPEHNGDWKLKKHDFIEKRLAMLDVMLKNLSNGLTAETPDNKPLILANQAHIDSVVLLLNSMKDICERFATNTQARASYVAFCKEIFDILSRHPRVANQQRLSTLMAWLRSLS
ncbi:Mus7/MMS22 family-domain-containing protein [Cerioporus squamosus]|nr:Mus7/MMS22 family-domain-containing protein [Cerioporus squamosus]